MWEFVVIWKMHSGFIYRGFLPLWLLTKRGFDLDLCSARGVLCSQGKQYHKQVN